MINIRAIRIIVLCIATIGALGCASKPVVPVSQLEPVVRADASCDGATTLERDLSNGGKYDGASQVYLNSDGKTCRYSQ